MGFLRGVHLNFCAMFLAGTFFMFLVAVPTVWSESPVAVAPGMGPVNCELDTFCSCTMPNGSRYDLTPLHSQTGKPYFQSVPGRTSAEKYAYDPCIPFNLGPDVEKMKCLQVAGCRMQTAANGKRNYSNIAKHLGVAFIYDPTTDQAFIHYINEELFHSIQTEVHLECLDPKSPTTLNLVKASETAVLFKLSSPKACLINPDQGGLSTGSILCILFSVCFIVYLVGGTLMGVFIQNKPVGDTIPPNKDFWLDLPSLIMDGAKFTMNGMKVTSPPHRRLGQAEDEDTDTYHDDLNDEEVDELKVQPSNALAEPSADGFSAVPV